MPKIADYYSNKGQERLCHIKVHFQYFNAEREKNKTHTDGNRINDIVAKIFLYIISLCFEHKQFVTNIRICNIDDGRKDHNDYIMNSLGKEVIQKGQRDI